MANALVKNNNICKNSKAQIRRFIVEAVRDVLLDPDFGLELSAGTIRDLKKSIKQKKEGKVIALEEILKKYKAK